MKKAILLISCHDQKGITAAVTDFVFKNNGNILHADQHIDDQSNTFFMRVEWDLKGFKLKKEKIKKDFQVIANKFKMNISLHFSDDVVKAAVFVSKHLHCLNDLLLRYRAGHFNCRIPLIVSNHPDAKEVAEDLGIPFFEFPVTPRTKTQQENRQIELLKTGDVELIILARYHQILSKNFVKHFENRIINIHHSFLPAFAGQRPYAQAYRKGVKIIGATSHYVTETLDGGPIIEQDTIRVSHRDDLPDLVRKGEDLEKIVLSRAVSWYLKRKILCYGNKTVIFD